MKPDRDAPKPAAAAVPAWTNRRIDQRIIDSCVADEIDTALFGELAARGVSSAAVHARARAIGVTREFIKECRLSDSRPAMRSCINCAFWFLSSGIQNRLCRRCASR
jgi:hypothetical protein